MRLIVSDSWALILSFSFSFWFTFLVLFLYRESLTDVTGFGGCKFISFEDRHWHSECFACSKCESNLVGRGFLTSDDLIMCSECGR
ncbi:unnamed protein product [Protopolystoma xenopodis]|uniref:LIM zinc-binding domain-containing protein n=1 Tax=Protopolystoma xenopodis TaxID=117903 RepID=A0A448WN89_9PLAT|nr:unnamed protein product [Protopolystoma xenopodis]